MKLLNHPVVYTFFTLFVIVLCISLYLNGQKIRQSNDRIEQLREEIREEVARTSQVELILQEVKAPENKERKIRDQLLKQKPNEYVVQIPDVVLPTSTPGPSPSAKPVIDQWKEVLLQN